MVAKNNPPGTFEFEGGTYSYVRSPKQFNIDEMEVIEVAYGGEINEIMRVRMRALRVCFWVSVHRGRCGCIPGFNGMNPDCEFTLKDAGRVDMEIVSAQAPEPVAAPLDHLPAGAVLTPTSAEPSPSEVPPNRAARRTAGKRASTVQRSRTSSPSARGKSDS